MFTVMQTDPRALVDHRLNAIKIPIRPGKFPPLQARAERIRSEARH
ncbi:MAG: hypothetical protein WCK83_13220 [Burkholderiales bacterium]|nr:hypothetical protein [Burkholderiales bacterium]